MYMCSVTSSWWCLSLKDTKLIIPTTLNVTGLKAGSELEATSGILNVFAVGDVTPSNSSIYIKN